MFNGYMWEMYLKAGGNDVVEMFRRNFEEGITEEYGQAIATLRASYCPGGKILEGTVQQLQMAMEQWEDGGILEDGEYTIESATRFAYEDLLDTEKTSQRTFGLFANGVEYFTTLLALESPELFIPWYFRYNYNVFESIAREFEISLPQIPNKKDYEKRFLFYGEICEVLQDFREEHGMSPYELYAFLYDFAPKYIGGIDSYIIKELPDPKSTFFIGGTEEDAFFDMGEDAIACWQCSPDTRAGDMIVMYLRAPISAVDSVWRSVSVGFNDPFFHYYRCTYIAKPSKVKRVSLKELQADAILGQTPIVRKNMQGVNGVELKPSEYNHLMDLAEAKVPYLEFAVIDGDETFVNEKDVENKLIKPLLEKLEYGEEDYTQQLYIEIGNHNRALIPDFVLRPNREKGKQTAFALIEAKHHILNQKEMEEVKNQTRSYARQLKVEYAAIASKDKIWVFDDEVEELLLESTWSEMNNADVFSELFKLLGKKKK